MIRQVGHPGLAFALPLLRERSFQGLDLPRQGGQLRRRLGPGRRPGLLRGDGRGQGAGVDAILPRDLPEPLDRIAIEQVLGREQRLDRPRLVQPAHADQLGAGGDDGVQAVEPFGAGLPLGPAALHVGFPFEDLLSDMFGKRLEIGLGCGAP